MRSVIVATRHGKAVVELTDEHASSSHGVPVLLLEGRPVGAADVVPIPQRGADLVLSWAMHANQTPANIDAARHFLASWPDGPQIASRER